MKRIDVAIAVIQRRGQILVCQRKKNDTFGGFWEFPGGKREAGETLHQCLLRELREELDLDVTIGPALPAITHDYPTAKLTLHPFLCHHTNGEPKLIECQQAIWIDPRRLRKFRFPPANEALIDEVIRTTIPAATAEPPM